MKYKSINISLTNAKLGGTIPSINLPPIITCRPNAPCIKGCYALRGHWLLENVQKSLRENLQSYQNNPKQHFQDIIDFFHNEDVSYRFMRWFGCGDIVNYEYLKGMNHVARECREVKFLCFTKKFELVNQLVDDGLYQIPIQQNFKIVFSAWDKDFKIDNPWNFPIGYVNFRNKERNPVFPETSISCVGKCQTCKGCWSLQKGQSTIFNQH